MPKLKTILGVLMLVAPMLGMLVLALT